MTTPDSGKAKSTRCDELLTVMDLVLRCGLREACAAYELTESGLENAANRPFASGLPFEDSLHHASARTKVAAELFPPSPYVRGREPATSKPVIEQFLETVDPVHETEVEDRPERSCDRDPVELREVGGIQPPRLVPHDVASSKTSAVP